MRVPSPGVRGSAFAAPVPPQTFAEGIFVWRKREMASIYEFLNELYLLGTPDNKVVLSTFPYYPNIPTHEQAQKIINTIVKFYNSHTPEEIEAINKAGDHWWHEYNYSRSRSVRESTPRKIVPGYVYLLRGDNGYYKIGRSKSPETRIKSLDVKLPFPIEAIQLIQTSDMIGLEKELHERFTEKRVNGEWFALEPADVEYIKGLAS